LQIPEGHVIGKAAGVEKLNLDRPLVAAGR
jgi:hypothetical protein